MHRWSGAAVGLGAVLGMGLAIGLGTSASAEVMSTFDSDAEGWGTLNDARDAEWTGDVGNPAGAFTAQDRGTGAIWFYSASDAYLGNRSGTLGGSLSWDILGLRGNQTSLPAPADVMLFGAGLEIGIDADVLPSTDDWTSWSVDLLASAGWNYVTSTSSGALNSVSVTEADFAAVLADLTGLFIRGEYTNGSDASALDNVLLVPAPGAIGVAGLAGLVALRRRR